MLVLPTTADGVGDPGIGVLLVAILGTVGYDIGGFFVGRNAGTRPLSAASPNKTVEGLVGGIARRRPASRVVRRRADRAVQRGRASATALLLGVASPSPPRSATCAESLHQARPRREGHGHDPARPRRLARPLRRLLFVLPAVYYLARSSCTEVSLRSLVPFRRF